MTLSFFLRGSSDLKTIYMRIRDGRDVDLVQSTGFTIHVSKWDKKKMYPKNDLQEESLEQLIINLNSISGSIRDYNNGPGRALNKDRNWLQNAVNFNGSKTEEKLLLTQAIERYRNFLKLKQTGRSKGVAQGTLNSYNNTKRRIEKYQIAKRSQLFLSDLSLDFHSDYLEFAKETLKLSVNSIGRDIKNIKAVCNDSKARGTKVHEHVSLRRFFAPSEKVPFVTLSLEEIEKIFNYKGSERLERTRDWLIIGVYNGCRVEDLLSLTKDNLQNENLKTYIRYRQGKTEKLVYNVLHPYVERVIEKYNGDFPERLSSVKFNENLKDLCKACEMDEPTEGRLFNKESKRTEKGIYPKYKLISSKTLRRSFASLHYGKIPTSALIKVTGHSTEKMLKIYIREESDTEHLSAFENLWKSSNQ